MLIFLFLIILKSACKLLYEINQDYSFKIILLFLLELMLKFNLIIQLIIILHLY